LDGFVAGVFLAAGGHVIVLAKGALLLLSFLLVNRVPDLVVLGEERVNLVAVVRRGAARGGGLGGFAALLHFISVLLLKLLSVLASLQSVCKRVGDALCRGKALCERLLWIRGSITSVSGESTFAQLSN